MFASHVKTLTNTNSYISDKIAAVKRIAEIVAISSYDTEAEMKEKDRLLNRHINIRTRIISYGTRNPIARHCYSFHE